MSNNALCNLANAVRAGEPVPLGRGETAADVLSEAVAEIARRLNTAMYAPTAEERDELEERLAAMDAERFDGLG